MFDTYIRSPGADFVLMRPPLVTVVLLLLASIRFSRDARKLRKEFGTVRYQPLAAGEPYHSTMWFRDKQHTGFASCSRDRCEDGRCLWLVRLFEKKDGRWALANDYHLGVPNKK